MPQVEINYVAVVIAAVLNMAIGFFWYSKALFAKQWMKAIGKTEAEIKAGGNNAAYGLTMVGALVMAWVLSFMVDYADAFTAVDGAKLGFLVWLGFVATTYLSLKVFEGRSWELYWINAGYYLVSLVATGAVLAVMV